MNSTLEEEIKAEIAKDSKKYLEEPVEDRPAYYFNNFHLNLPFGGRRELLKNYLDRKDCGHAGKTPREFFADVDRAVHDAGIEFKKIEVLQKNSKEIRTRVELFNLVFPAYVRLREMGYSRYDLNR